MTVAELMVILENIPEDAKVTFASADALTTSQAILGSTEDVTSIVYSGKVPAGRSENAAMTEVNTEDGLRYAALFNEVVLVS